MKLGDYLNSINHNKENLLRDGDEREEKSYAPYVVNRCLSYFPDTIFLVNAANSIPNIDKKFHFEYLLYSVRKRKRWSKWLKKEENEKIKWIKEYYGVSTKRAEEYFNILSEDQLEQIKSVTTYGEKNK
tara:strand:- start:663 stop:1049 length:387 start_codon:yes stop_codon:yes gene_type:complete